MICQRNISYNGWLNKNKKLTCRFVMYRVPMVIGGTLRLLTRLVRRSPRVRRLRPSVTSPSRPTTKRGRGTIGGTPRVGGRPDRTETSLWGGETGTGGSNRGQERDDSPHHWRDRGSVSRSCDLEWEIKSRNRNNATYSNSSTVRL